MEQNATTKSTVLLENSFGEFPAMRVSCGPVTCEAKGGDEDECLIALSPAVRGSSAYWAGLDTTMNSPVEGSQSAGRQDKATRQSERLQISMHSRRNVAVNVTPPTISQTQSK